MTEELIPKIKEKIEKLESVKAKVGPAKDKTKELIEKLDFFIDWHKEMLSDLASGLIDFESYGVIHKIANSSEVDSLENTLFPDNGELQYNELNSELLYSTYQSHNTYKVLKALGFSKTNSVIVGANGSGKTTLANSFSKVFNMDVGTVIPAHKFLSIPQLSYTPNYETEMKSYDRFEKNTGSEKLEFKPNRGVYQSNFTTQKFIEDYSRVVSTLMAERNLKRNEYCDKKQKKEDIPESALACKLDLALEIWNDLIQHRILFCNTSNNLRVRDETMPPNYQPQEYDVNLMSDGEKVLFYLIGKVLLAKGSHIIIDEPEMYLHKTIINKLWDRLEKECRNYRFIYLTHDLDFAASRCGQKAWIKSFTHPNTWDIKVIEDNTIPEELLLKLLGSQKKILFCEGTETSLDKRIFEILFPNFTVTSVGSCKNVISYTRTFNHIEHTNTQAYGIIDKDFRELKEIEKYKKDYIYAHDVAEIENLFLLEDFLNAYAKTINAIDKVSDIKNKIIALFSSDKANQAARFVSNRINHIFKAQFVKSGSDLSTIESNYEDFTNQIQIKIWYTNKLSHIEELVAKDDYHEVVRIFNNKGAHVIVEREFRVNHYHKKAIDFLINSNEAQDIFRRTLPIELSNG